MLSSRLLRGYLKYLAFRLSLVIFGPLPRPVLYELAKGFGDAFYVLNARGRRAARANLRHVLGPGASNQQLESLVRETFRHGARYYGDLVSLPRLNVGEFLRCSLRVQGSEHLEGALRAGRGVILASAHYGNPELVGQIFARLDMPLLVPTEPLEPEALSRLFDGLRSAHGLRFIPVGYTAMKEAYRTLRSSGVVALALDRDVMGGGVPLPLFGQPAMVPTGITDLALRTGAAVIPAFCRRRGTRFELDFLAPLELERTGNRQRDLRAGTERLLRLFEEHVRQDPSQWTVLEPVWERRHDCGVY